MFTAERYAKMLAMKSRNRLAYCSGWTVEISAPACNKERRPSASTASMTWGTNPPPAGLSPATHPVFDSFCCMSRFLLRVVLSENIDQAHEINLPLRGSWEEEQSALCCWAWTSDEKTWKFKHFTTLPKLISSAGHKPKNWTDQNVTWW